MMISALFCCYFATLLLIWLFSDEKSKHIAGLLP